MSVRQIEITFHAHERALERGLPDELRDLLERQEHRFRIHADYGGTAWAAILHVTGGYWIGVTSDHNLLTVYHVPSDQITDWGWRHLMNESQISQVTALPLNLTQKENTTKELATIWLDSPCE